MTELRDARLRQALDVAPDAQLRPLPRTREAVLAAAHAAVARPWWSRLWAPGGASRMPWNAALATVLVAGFVVVLWQGQEAPPAQPEAKADRASPPADSLKKKEAAGAVVAKPGAVVAEEAATLSPAPASAPQPSRAAAKAAAPAEPARERQDAPAAIAKDQAPQPVPAKLGKQAARAESQAVPTQDQAAAAPGSAQPAERPALAAPAPAPAPAALAAAPSPAAHPPRAASPPPMAAAASAAGVRSAPPPAAQGNDSATASLEGRARPDASAAMRWTRLRIEGAGKVVEVARNDTGRLAQDVERLLATLSSAPLGEEAEFRVRLMDGTRQLGTLVLGRSQSGWTPGAEAGMPRGLAADPVLVQAVRSEVERWLAR